MELFSHKNEVQRHARTWMNLNNTMLNDRSQLQKITYYSILMKSSEWVNL